MPSNTAHCRSLRDVCAFRGFVENNRQVRRVRLTWLEWGGRRLEPLGEKGFGTQLIERACAYELEGEVELDCAPEGLICEVVFPLP
jgi:two-component system CheB/CheR fusion protein